MNLSIKTITLLPVKPFHWPVGTDCKRDPMKCESNRYDKGCMKKTCPFNGRK